MTRTVFKIGYTVVSVSLLVYMLMPGPKSISDFPSLPNSIKSTLEGDTIQVPNISAYFSDNFRGSVIPFYINAYQNKTLFPFSPLRLNYPPEDAYKAIKDQTKSTFLEELTYPLRDSLFINGLEPVDEEGLPRYLGGGKFEVDDKLLSTKITLRYYPSSISVRIVTWLGINLSFLILVSLSRKVFKHA